MPVVLNLVATIAPEPEVVILQPVVQIIEAELLVPLPIVVKVGDAAGVCQFAALPLVAVST